MNPSASGVKGHIAPAPRIGVPFAAIPLDVKARRDVSPAAKLVFVTVANQARMRRGEVSNLTNRQISDRAGLSVAAVRRGLDQLETIGLVRRLYGDSKRTRLGVAVAYQPVLGVAQIEQPSRTGVAQARQPGCSASPSGGCARRATDLLRGGEEHSEKVPRPQGRGDSDAALRVASGPEAARYLRLCIEAGRRGEPMPSPPIPSGPAGTPQDAVTSRTAPTGVPAVARPATAKPALSASRACSPALAVHPDAASREVTRMIRGLAEGLKSPDVGRRRVGPTQLARQLAELRRRHGRRQ